MWWIMEKNVNTELEQIGVSLSDGVIYLFRGVFQFKQKVPPFGLFV